MKRILSLLVAGIVAIAAPAFAGEPLKVGVSTGPYAEILEYVGKLYKEKYGDDVKVIEFSDYTLPDAALAQGDIDFNNYQHLPYLENQIKTRGYDLVPLEKSIIVPLGVYSKRLTSLEKLSDGARVSIPNDPANLSRSLILLQQAKLITLPPNAGPQTVVADIVGNPKHLKFVELDAAQLPRSLDDVEIGAVTLNYAVAAGLDPSQAIFLEGADTPWNLWFVARRQDKENQRIWNYIRLYRSPEVKAFIEKRFGKSIIATW
ncbi:MAG TPA: MetQ/NlpA family ABC transporter substrate-binding protein [Telmatospirillum sp.]|nr:MetQ/NlpA family ABC transporter substrate-binding protein [Telmatospirillum sp.]